MQPATLV